MGAITRGIPREHVTTLKSLGSYVGLVETGTYLGATSRWAAKLFAQVHTVEASPELFARAQKALAKTPSVVQHLGRSPTVLRKMVPTLQGPWLFWLDAHWSGGLTFGQDQECPLLEELEIVVSSGAHGVLVDDARLFLRPLGAPHDWRQWPSIDEICATIRDHGSGRFSVTIVDDVLFALPRTVHESWCDHLHRMASSPRGIAGWFGRAR